MARLSLLSAVACLLVLGGTAWAVAPGDQISCEVPLPPAMASPVYQQLSEADAARLIPGWDAFTRAHGEGWTVASYRRELGTPAALIGPSFPLAAPGSGDGVLREAALRFIGDNAPLLKVDPAQLAPPEITSLMEGKRLFRFGQTYQGLEVVGGGAQIFTSDGKLVLAGSEFYPGIALGTVAAVSPSQAAMDAVGPIPFNPLTDQMEGSPRLVVYPMILQGAPEYFLAWEVTFETRKPVGQWCAYVDASDG